MPKFQIEATELVDPDVNLVSLVKRGANRIPFRITKSEDKEDMIDLASLGRKMGFVKKDIAPGIVAVVIAKGDEARTAKIVKALTDAGLPLDKLVKSEKDAQINFAKADTENLKPEQVCVIKLSDEVGVVLTGEEEFVKSISTYDWDSTSFSDIMQKGSFMPSLAVAQDMLSRTYYNILDQAESPNDLAALMKAAGNDFNTYVVQLCKGLPAAVFKADVALTKIRKEDISANPVYGNQPTGNALAPNAGAGAPDNDIEGSPSEGNPKGKTGTKVQELPGTVNNDIEGDPAEGNPWGVTGATLSPMVKAAMDTAIANKMPADVMKTMLEGMIKAEGGEIPKAVEKKDEKKEPKTEAAKEPKKEEAKKEEAPVLAAIEALAKSLDARFEKQQGDVDKALKAVSENVTKLGDRVKKAEETVTGTALGDATDDKTGMKKNDNDPSTGRAPPLLDTGYSRGDDPQSVGEAVRGGRARHRN